LRRRATRRSSPELDQIHATNLLARAAIWLYQEWVNIARDERQARGDSARAQDGGVARARIAADPRHRSCRGCAPSDLRHPSAREPRADGAVDQRPHGSAPSSGTHYAGGPGSHSAVPAGPVDHHALGAGPVGQHAVSFDADDSVKAHISSRNEQRVPRGVQHGLPRLGAVIVIVVARRRDRLGSDHDLQLLRPSCVGQCRVRRRRRCRRFAGGSSSRRSRPGQSDGKPGPRFGAVDRAATGQARLATERMPFVGYPEGAPATDAPDRIRTQSLVRPQPGRRDSRGESEPREPDRTGGRDRPSACLSRKQLRECYSVALGARDRGRTHAVRGNPAHARPGAVPAGGEVGRRVTCAWTRSPTRASARRCVPVGPRSGSQPDGICR
jgi:hypothetical protein